MEYRGEAILSTLKKLSNLHPGVPLNIIEIGCMFKEDEGLSTFLIADFLARRQGGGKFISMDCEQSHIESSQRLIAARNPALATWVEYRQGHSMALLPEVARAMAPIHFAFLDGGGHPEVCLQEFEVTAAHLAPDGVIVVDDAGEMEPTGNYRLPRPFGKATLILPALIIGEYLANRDAMRGANSLAGQGDSLPDARFLSGLAVPFGVAAYAVLDQRMLVYGNRSVVATLCGAFRQQSRYQELSLKGLLGLFLARLCRIWR